MADWTAGYVADLEYTFGYYGELNPHRAQLPLLSAGYEVPQFVNACELGFGQGVSVNMHAAGTPVKWYGTDFNPTQAAFAQDIARVSGSGANLSDESFAEFCSRGDLPDFDFIGLHGIWSWISDANRAVVVDFLRRKLRPGGVLFISYNTQPGWAAMIPVRHLLTEHANKAGSQGQGTKGKVESALAFVDKVLKTDSAFVQINPTVRDRFERLKSQNPNYLAHEYFNLDWKPMPFSEVEGWLSSAKLTYACSANYLDQIEPLNLTPDQTAFLNGNVTDASFRETVRDYFVNQQFRRDYWIKGPRKMTPLRKLEIQRKQRVILVRPRDEIMFTTKGPVGEIQLQRAIYEPILDTLADYRPKSVADLEAALAGKNITTPQILQAILLLAGRADVLAVSDDISQADALPKCERINRHLLNAARADGSVAYLASSVVGSAFAVPRFDQLFLLGRMHGAMDAQQLGEFVWSILASQGQKIVRDGNTIERVEDNIAELISQAGTFVGKKLPIYRALGLCPA